MAISANCVWEIRASATAGNVNGGGFVTGASGTDYSQQDAAQYNLTGGTSAGAGAVVLHASAAAVMVGNIARIKGTNTTSGWYEIISVVAGVSITVDRNCTTGVGAAITVDIGGALSLGGNTASFRDDDVFENGVAGQIFYIKNGTYTMSTSVVTTSAVGGVSNPIRVIGYNATRGDNPLSTNRPTLAMATVAWTAGANWDFYYLRYTGTGTSCLTLGTNGKALYVKCTNTSTTAARAGLVIGADGCAYQCEGISYRGYGIQVASTSVALYCYAHDSDIGFALTGTTNVCSLRGCISESNVTAAIKSTAALSASAVLDGCTLYGSENKTGIGLSLFTGSTDTRLIGCIIYGFVTGVSHADVQTVSFSDFNTFNNNTTNRTNWAAGANDITTAPAFASVSQVTVTTATTSNTGNTLTKAGATFVTSGVTAGRDCVYISASGTGTVGVYGIASVDSETQLTLDLAPGNSTADVSAQITVGRNFATGAAMREVGVAMIYPSGTQTGYTKIGAVGRAIDFPAVADVRLATTFDNATKTGTARIPAIANVKTGYAYDSSDSLTGTYTGSDRWTDPAIANVRSGTAYKADSLTNNRTGTLDLPAVADVRLATTFDGASKTGTARIPAIANVKTGYAYDSSDSLTGTYTGSDRWSDPSVANVRLGTTYKADSLTNNRTGTLDLPAVADVRLATNFDNATKTGTARIPAITNVKVGYAYDSSDSLTGSYDGSDRWSDPGLANVRSGTAYKANSTSNNMTGVLDLPGVANVRLGTVFDNSTKTGTVRVPAAAFVKTGYAYDASDASTGSYDGSDRWSDPGVANVLLGTNYLVNASTFTGTLPVGTSTDPGVANVLSGTVYKINGTTLTGTLAYGSNTDPGIANVRLNTSYLFGGNTLTGTLIVPGTSVNSTATAALNDIKETIQSIMLAANTTTGTPIDLSHGLSNSKRVQTVFKIHPEMILPQASLFPLVTCYIETKEIARMDIAKTQLAAKRRAKVKIKIVGSLWNNNFVSTDEDPADEDINHLMENIELIMRGDPSLSGVVNWQLASGCRYFTSILDEQTHLRSGILDVDCEVFY